MVIKLTKGDEARLIHLLKSLQMDMRGSYDGLPSWDTNDADNWDAMHVNVQDIANILKLDIEQ